MNILYTERCLHAKLTYFALHNNDTFKKNYLKRTTTNIIRIASFMYQLHNLSPTFLNMPEVEIVLDVFCWSHLYFRIDECLSVIKVLIIRPHPRRYAIQFLNPRNSIARVLPATFLYKNRRTHLFKSVLAK